MISNSEPIHVPAGSELGERIRAAADSGERFTVGIDDETYTLSAIPAARKPSSEMVERSIAGIRKASGTWKDIDAERLKAYIRERRRASSRPRVEL